jgi:predicted P-loop ATPase
LDDPELIQDAKFEQRARYQEDPWHDRIREFLMGKPEVSLSQVLESVGVELARQGQAEQNRAAKTLKALGWRKTQVRRGDDRPRVYVPSPLSPVSTSRSEISKKGGGRGEELRSGIDQGTGAVTRDSGDAGEGA